MHFGGNHDLYSNDFINIFKNSGHRMMIVRFVIHPMVYYCLSESLEHTYDENGST